MFNLTDYETDIRNYAATQHVAPDEAAKRFIYNLNGLRDHFTGFNNNINFRELGQVWSALPSDERIAQRNRILLIVEKPVRNNRSMRSEDNG